MNPRYDFVWLASQSPRRQALLAQIGVAQQPLLPGAEEDAEALEDMQPGELPLAYVQLKPGATVAAGELEQWVREAADASFNRITIDGDTSTNDSLLLVATGAGALDADGAGGQAAAALKAAIIEVALELAQAIVRDGEGATKFISVVVERAGSPAEASAVAYAIAHSPLVKTAFFASDPNLGRILAAVGYAGIDDLDQTDIDLYLGDVHVATRGGRHPDYREEDGQRVMKQAEITIRVVLNRGEMTTTVWTCDLSHDYVSINADYRS